jgi:proline iminopeptidase
MDDRRGPDTDDVPPSHAWQVMYPPIAAHASGRLEVGDGHTLYWETSGHPLGLPALFLHGGPGAGCTPDDRRWFDPARYRTVLFDQRGAGRSQPAGRTDMNTTAHLVRDIESLRAHLGIERWLVFGGSWGATLALAYAQAHPQRVRALVLRGSFGATRRERDWLYGPEGAAVRHPQAWQRLTDRIGLAPGTGLVEHVARMLDSNDHARRHGAAQAWLAWEDALTDPQGEAPPPTRSAADALAMARIGVHYACHGWFLDEGQLLRDAGALRGVPGVLVHGDADQVTPPDFAHALHRAWPGSALHVVAGAGHSSREPRSAARLIAATDHFATTTT